MDALSGMAAITAYIDLAITHMGQTGDACAYFLLLSSSLDDNGGLRARFQETHAAVAEQLQDWIGEGSSGRRDRAVDRRQIGRVDDRLHDLRDGDAVPDRSRHGHLAGA